MRVRLAPIAIIFTGLPALSVAQVATPPSGAATEAVLDRPAPPWLKIGGQARARLEGYTGGGFAPGNSDQYLLTRLFLNARIQPVTAFSLFIEGSDARGVWKNKTPAGPPFRNSADLRQLFLQVGQDKGTQMRAGRLEMLFGDGRLVGPSLWTNTGRTFDGARGALVGEGYRVDAFATSVVKVVQDKFDRNVPGNNFYGLYGSTTRLGSKLTVEPFFFWRRQSGLTSEAGVKGTMNFGTLGLRAVGKLRSGVDYDAQLASQRGSLGDESISAWAGHWVLGYTTAGVVLTPRIFAEYNQASGDANPTDNRKTTFDQLYPTGHEKYGLADLVGWQNMKHARAGIDVSLSKSWNATVRYNNYWLADAHDALYSGAGAPVVRSATGTAGTYVGREFDLITSAKLRPGLGFSAGAGHFAPGTFLRNTTPGRSYVYPYAMLTYDF
jgi:Alginate export